MVMLDEHGSMELDELIAPAIALARNGVPVSRSLASFIVAEQTHIRRHDATAAVFLPDGRPPAVGETLYQRDLADTLESIAAAYRASRSRGRSEAIAAARDHYYRGPIADAIVEYSQRHGGFLTLDDFARFQAETVEPLSIRYRGLTVYSPPPNSQGIAMLMALRIIDGFDLSGRRPDDPYVVHRVVEATKLAKIDTWHYVGDPEFVDVPVARLLSDDHAVRQRQRIEADRVIEWPTEGGLWGGARDTTTFSVVDRYGNAVAVTTSIGSQFLIAGETGINLNQRMANMETLDGNPNVIAPGKKVRHTVNPYLALSGDRLRLVGGNTGFDTQPQGQIQQFLNIVEFGLTAQEAVSRPRYITHAFPSSTFPYDATNLLFVERGMPGSTVAALSDIGHTIGGSAIIGNGNVTVIDPASGSITVGADPRGDNLGLVGPLR
jgi:gamma-glutamyltranspeptidase / glutathione hydrolase